MLGVLVLLLLLVVFLQSALQSRREAQAMHAAEATDEPGTS